jgi:hypothetical protein
MGRGGAARRPQEGSRASRRRWHERSGDGRDDEPPDEVGRRPTAPQARGSREDEARRSDLRRLLAPDGEQTAYDAMCNLTRQDFRAARVRHRGTVLPQVPCCHRPTAPRLLRPPCSLLAVSSYHSTRKSIHVSQLHPALRRPRRSERPAKRSITRALRASSPVSRPSSSQTSPERPSASARSRSSDTLPGSTTPACTNHSATGHPAKSTPSTLSQTSRSAAASTTTSPSQSPRSH